MAAPVAECKMKIFTGTSWSKDNQQKCIDYGIGMVSTPKDLVQPSDIPSEIPVIWDNGAFHGGFDKDLYINQTEKIDRDIVFAVLPDVVGEAKASIALSKQWLNDVPYRKYLALQDGMDFGMVHPILSECDGAFLGGSVEWKWDTMQYWVNKVHSLGLPIHIGRCNGLKQWDKAALLGADSVDGSTAIRHNMLDCIPRFFLHFKEQQRWVHYVDKEDLYAQVGTAAYQEMSS